jgi:oligogalacturonide transport system substrate-binding protein
MKSKKFLVLIGMALIALFVFAACGGGNNDSGGTAAPTQRPAGATAAPTPTPAPAIVDAAWSPNSIGPTTISMAWWGADPRHNAVNAALDLFTAKYPHITIERSYTAFTGFMDNLILQLGARNAPDIFQSNYAWVHTFLDGENPYFDLNTVAGILDLSEWSPDMLAAMTTSDGQLAAVPHGMTGRVIVYNKLMLAEYGLDKFPETIDEWVALGEKIAEGNTELETGENTYAFFPLGQESLDIVILSMLYNNTGKNMQENNRMLHTIDEVEVIFNVIGRLIETGVIPTFVQQEPPHDNTNPVWVQGRAGAVYEWVSNIFVVGNAFLGGNNLDNLGVALIPAITAGGSQDIMQRPSIGHAISPHTQHPELAAYVLNFLYTDDAALTVLANQFGIPSSRSAVAVSERDNNTVGLQLEGLEMLLANPAEMCYMFEDPSLRQAVRFPIIEAFRMGNINAREAATRWVNEQQAVLSAR